MVSHTIFWQRLDVPGHDACRLVQEDNGWRLEGAAVFLHEGAPACLVYEIGCDAGWQTREGSVRGWAGAQPVDLRVARRPDGSWTLNNRIAPGLEGCVDLDFGFTPATNLFQLRRIALRAGQTADVPAAWLDAPAGTLDRLDQRYERRSAETYWYEAPRFGYAALLRVGPTGFVETYPDLWEAET